MSWSNTIYSQAGCTVENPPVPIDTLACFSTVSSQSSDGPSSIPSRRRNYPKIALIMVYGGMAMNPRDWVFKNCNFAKSDRGVRKVAAFMPPQKGSRIEVPNRPGEYYLVIDKPEVGRDPRGYQFWQARVKDREGKEQRLSSDQVASWSHFKGQNYQWHDEDNERQKWANQQKEQATLIQGFEAKFKFPDGQPLRKNPNRPMLLSIVENAPGNLNVFSGEKVYLKDIDYQSATVKLEPISPDFAEFAPHLAAIPAAEVVAGTKPAMRAEVVMEPVRLPSGEKVTAGDMMKMTPELNKLARMPGKIGLEAQVYANYQGKGFGGEDYFVNEMGKRGIEAEHVQSLTNYRINNVQPKVDEMGKRLNIFGAWQGNVMIEPPISPEVEAEIRAIAPESQIQKRRDGKILVQSNALYKQMVSLGVLDHQANQPQPAKGLTTGPVPSPMSA